MSAAVGLRDDFTAADLRRLAGKAKDAAQARRLLALAAVYDGMDRATAARIGGMDRQTLRDWAHRFNEHGPVGLINVKPTGRRPKLSVEQQEHCGSWWRPAPIRRSMAWSAGDAWTCSVSLEPSSASICRQSRLVASSSGLASRISAPARCTPHRMRRRLRLLKKFPALVAEVVNTLAPATPIEIWFQDEMRVGQKNGLVYQWAKKGTRPRQPKDQRYENAYLFGAVCPGRNTGIAVIMPHADTEAMQKHIDEISVAVTPGAHALIILDKAAWHSTRKLKLPENLTLVRCRRLARN